MCTNLRIYPQLMDSVEKSIGGGACVQVNNFNQAPTCHNLVKEY